MWQRYLRERERRRQIVGIRSRQPKWLLGGGLTVCGNCGRNLIITTYQSGKPSLAKCVSYHDRRDCTGVWIKRETVEWCVEVWLETYLEQLGEAYDALHAEQDANERTQLAHEIEMAREESRRLDEGRVNALALVACNLATDEEFEKITRDIEHDRIGITRKIDELQTQLDAMEPDPDYLERLDGFMEATPDEQNLLEEGSPARRRVHGGDHDHPVATRCLGLEPNSG